MSEVSAEDRQLNSAFVFKMNSTINTAVLINQVTSLLSAPSSIFLSLTSDIFQNIL